MDSLLEILYMSVQRTTSVRLQLEQFLPMPFTTSSRNIAYALLNFIADIIHMYYSSNDMKEEVTISQE